MGDALPGVAAGGRGARAPGHRRQLVIVPEELAERLGEGHAIAGRNRPGRAGGGDLGEAADVAEQQRQPRAERGVGDTGLVDLAVGQHDEARAAQQRRHLPIGDEPGQEPHPRRRAGAKRADVHPRHAHDPQLGPPVGGREHGPGIEQHVDPLVGTKQAEEQGHRRPRAGQLGREPPVRARVLGGRGWKQSPMRDHVHPCGLDAELPDQPTAPVRGVDDDGVEALVEATLCSALSGSRFAREDVVRGQHEGSSGARRPAPARQQAPIEMLDGEPLEVHDIGAPRGSSIAEHVGHVLAELRQPSQPRGARAGGQAIEELVPGVSLGGRRRSVGEAARVQLHVRPGGRQRAAESVVIGRRVGRGVDDVDAHGKDNRCARRDNARVRPVETAPQHAAQGGEVELSYCVVNTSQRELLLRGLDAIARERDSLPFSTEVLVLDNGSRDGSAQAAREHAAVDETIALPKRRGKALNDSELLARARGRYALLLNEDSELRPGASGALHGALSARPDVACAGAKLLRPDGVAQPSAWRFPTVATALAGALLLHRIFTVQSNGRRIREVDWCQSAALLVRRAAAEQVGYLDPAFFVYSDEVDFARRLRDAGWRSVYVPEATAIHHEQLSTDTVPERRIVELARNRDLYMRKHHSPAAARAVRWLTAWTYALRALAALILPHHSSRRYWRHVTATLWPSRGEGLREAADDYNRGA